MKQTTICSLACVLVLFNIGYAQQPKSKETKSTTWNVDNLKRIGQQQVTIIGGPQVIDTPEGKAVMFDGIDDGLELNSNPVAGANAFTVEAIFRPDLNGSKEQRWLHLQQDQTENRVLLETRLDGDQWFVDSFIKSGENSCVLFAENFKHKLGAWYHVALVYDGREMRHYVDGEKEMAGPLAISPLGEGKTSIGVRLNRVYWFKGAVRKVRFTPRALTPSEFMKKN
jgi:hypothetical protein